MFEVSYQHSLHIKTIAQKVSLSLSLPTSKSTLLVTLFSHFMVAQHKKHVQHTVDKNKTKQTNRQKKTLHSILYISNYGNLFHIAVVYSDIQTESSTVSLQTASSQWSGKAVPHITDMSRGARIFSILQVNNSFIWGPTTLGARNFCLVGHKTWFKPGP